jgi:hypothetical protein
MVLRIYSGYHLNIFPEAELQKKKKVRSRQETNLIYAELSEVNSDAV